MLSCMCRYAGVFTVHDAGIGCMRLGKPRPWLPVQGCKICPAVVLSADQQHSSTALIVTRVMHAADAAACVQGGNRSVMKSNAARDFVTIVAQDVLMA